MIYTRDEWVSFQRMQTGKRTTKRITHFFLPNSFLRMLSSVRLSMCKIFFMVGRMSRCTKQYYKLMLSIIRYENNFCMRHPFGQTNARQTRHAFKFCFFFFVDRQTVTSCFFSFANNQNNGMTVFVSHHTPNKRMLAVLVHIVRFWYDISGANLMFFFRLKIRCGGSVTKRLFLRLFVELLQ